MLRKTILSLFLSAMGFLGFAQAVPDASFTDCNSNTRTVYGALGAGKVLLVANAGTNCSICMGHAGQIGSYATTNMANVEVWGSMTTKSGGNVNCTTVSNWVSTYGWADVFAFADLNKYWFNIASPGFTVISPIDSSIVYQGSSWNAARNAADALVASLSVDEEDVLSGLIVRSTAIELSLRETTNGGTASIIDLTGKEIERWRIEPGLQQYSLPLNRQLPGGIYVLKLSLGDKEVIEKITL